jgi:hypothetical protein
MTIDYLKYSLLTVVFSIYFSCPGQHADKADTGSKKISKHKFDSLVDNSIKLLRTRELTKITDEEHISIMYCLNTIFVRGTKDDSFKAGRYKRLEELAYKDYVNEIIQIYPDWTANRGMGYYFPKLKMELYGTPSSKSVYQIQD